MWACWRLPATPDREIADDLGVPVRTIENHLQRSYEQLGVAGRSELKAALEDGV